MSGCDHNCASCGGCGKSLSLTEAEIEMLQMLAQIPFLPVARRMDDDIPVYLEEQAYTREEYSLFLQCLEKRGLISIDYDKPLKSFDDHAYSAYPVRGSFALTARGQQVLDVLEMQGID